MPECAWHIPNEHLGFVACIRMWLWVLPRPSENLPRILSLRGLVSIKSHPSTTLEAYVGKWSATAVDAFAASRTRAAAARYLCLRCTQLSCESGTLHTRLPTAGTHEMLGPDCFHFTVYMDEPPFAACLPVYTVRGCRGDPGPSLGRRGGFFLPAQPQPRDRPAGTCTQQLAVTHHRRPDC